MEILIYGLILGRSILSKLDFCIQMTKKKILFLMSSLEESSILMNPDFPWTGPRGDVEEDRQPDYSKEAYHIMEDLPQNPV